MSIESRGVPEPRIRVATEDDLKWMYAEPDPEQMARIKAEEIDRALTATAVPRHWAPVEVDDSLLR